MNTGKNGEFPVDGGFTLLVGRREKEERLKEESILETIQISIFV